MKMQSKHICEGIKMIMRTSAISILVVFALASAVSAQWYGLPSQVLSPVDAPLEVVGALGDCSNTLRCFKTDQF